MNILDRPVLQSDHRLPYGSDRSQFGDLWLPDAPGRHPLVVFFHGGWWKSEYDLGYAGYLCDALKREGIATWSVEYRRVGETGGGWPMTFLDAAAGFDFVSTLAREFPLDLKHLLVMGHSAGGHLAIWIAGRHHIAPDSELFPNNPLINLKGAVSLAGVADLRLAIELSGNPAFIRHREDVYALMGGSPSDLPRRYHAGNPGDLLPFQAPQVLIQGTDDDQIPPDLPLKWVELSQRLGSHATMKIVSGADHFDVVDPTSRAWETVLAQVKTLINV